MCKSNFVRNKLTTSPLYMDSDEFDIDNDQALLNTSLFFLGAGVV